MLTLTQVCVRNSQDAYLIAELQCFRVRHSCRNLSCRRSARTVGP
jgi:hypothetical protein